MAPVALMVVCGLLVLAGIVAVVRWGALPKLDAGDAPPVSRYARTLAAAVVGGAAAGLTIAGPGGRLVMRLLAATSPASAQGQITEAEQTVGAITFGGTVNFVLFTGLFFGAGTGLLYAVVRRWLPGGRVGGLAYGALLLVLVSTRIEPLRPGNRDFDIVGPAVVSLAAFGALVVAQGMAVSAFADRYAAALPLLRDAADARDLRKLAWYVPAAPVLLAGVIGAVIVVGALVAAVVGRNPQIRERLRSATVTTAGRVVLGVVALASLPGFIRGVTDIAGRGP
jgi:hypothetical protein